MEKSLDDDAEASRAKPTRPKKPQSLHCRLRDVVDPDRIAEHTRLRSSWTCEVVCIAERM